MTLDVSDAKMKAEDNYGEFALELFLELKCKQKYFHDADEKITFVNAISKPMASRKLTKKVYKLIKKASKERTKNIINGLKDVQTRIRKGEKGIVIFAGDVYPIDIMCHLPAVCEEKDIVYCFTPSRQDLGVAMGVKRGSITLMIRKNADYEELYEEVQAELKNLPHPF